MVATDKIKHIVDGPIRPISDKLVLEAVIELGHIIRRMNQNDEAGRAMLSIYYNNNYKHYENLNFSQCLIINNILFHQANTVFSPNELDEIPPVNILKDITFGKCIVDKLHAIEDEMFYTCQKKLKELKILYYILSKNLYLLIYNLIKKGAGNAIGRIFF